MGRRQVATEASAELLAAEFVGADAATKARKGAKGEGRVARRSVEVSPRERPRLSRTCSTDALRGPRSPPAPADAPRPRKTKAAAAGDAAARREGGGSPRGASRKIPESAPSTATSLLSPGGAARAPAGAGAGLDESPGEGPCSSRVKASLAPLDTSQGPRSTGGGKGQGLRTKAGAVKGVVESSPGGVSKPMEGKAGAGAKTPKKSPKSPSGHVKMVRSPADAFSYDPRAVCATPAIIESEAGAERKGKKKCASKARQSLMRSASGNMALALRQLPVEPEELSPPAVPVKQAIWELRGRRGASGPLRSQEGLDKEAPPSPDDHVWDGTTAELNNRQPRRHICPPATELQVLDLGTLSFDGGRPPADRRSERSPGHMPSMRKFCVDTPAQQKEHRPGRPRNAEAQPCIGRVVRSTPAGIPRIATATLPGSGLRRTISECAQAFGGTKVVHFADEEQPPGFVPALADPSLRKVRGSKADDEADPAMARLQEWLQGAKGIKPCVLEGSRGEDPAWGQGAQKLSQPAFPPKPPRLVQSRSAAGAPMQDALSGGRVRSKEAFAPVAEDDGAPIGCTIPHSASARRPSIRATGIPHSKSEALGVTSWGEPGRAAHNLSIGMMAPESSAPAVPDVGPHDFTCTHVDKPRSEDELEGSEVRVHGREEWRSVDFSQCVEGESNGPPPAMAGPLDTEEEAALALHFGLKTTGFTPAMARAYATACSSPAVALPQIRSNKGAAGALFEDREVDGERGGRVTTASGQPGPKPKLASALMAQLAELDDEAGEFAALKAKFTPPQKPPPARRAASKGTGHQTSLSLDELEAWGEGAGELHRGRTPGAPKVLSTGGDSAVNPILAELQDLEEHESMDMLWEEGVCSPVVVKEVKKQGSVRMSLVNSLKKMSLKKKLGGTGAVPLENGQRKSQLDAWNTIRASFSVV